MFTFAMLRKILFGVGSNSLPMERKELRHDRHMVSLLTDHMVFSPKYSVSYIAKRIKGRSSRELRKAVPHIRNGAAKVSGRRPASMARLVMDGTLWGDTFRIRRLRMRNRHIQALYYRGRLTIRNLISPNGALYRKISNQFCKISNCRTAPKVRGLVALERPKMA